MLDGVVVMVVLVFAMFSAQAEKPVILADTDSRACLCSTSCDRSDRCDCCIN